MLGSSTSSSAEANARSAPSARAASLRALERRGRDRRDASAGQAGGAGVDGADEAGAGDPGSKLRGHGREPMPRLVRLSSKSSAKIMLKSLNICLLHAVRLIGDDGRASPAGAVLPDQRGRAARRDPRRQGGDPRRPGAATRASRARRSRSASTRCSRPGSSTRPAAARRRAAGRRPSSRSTTRAGVVLVADLGATHSRVAVSDLAGDAARRGGRRHGHRARSRGGPRLGVRALRRAARADRAHRRRRARHRDRRPGAGRVRQRHGRSTRRSCPAGTATRSPSWFAEHYDAPVLVDNDVNIMARGEHWTHWRDTEHLLLVKVGTGIGCGIVAGGRIHHGAHGAAGDIGHIRATLEDVVCSCGNIGCLEAVAGGQALARRLAADGRGRARQPRRRRARAGGRRDRHAHGARGGPVARRGARRQP